MKPACPHCGDVNVDLECYRIGGDEAWLCPGCFADARRAGYRVVWLPGRMRSEQADAFRAALVTQAAIEAEQERRGREAEERWSPAAGVASGPKAAPSPRWSPTVARIRLSALTEA